MARWMIRGKPTTRGAVVRLRQGSSGTLTNQRGIVMGMAKADSYSRAYGPEVIVCELPSNAKQIFKIADDADREGRKVEAAKIRADAVDVSEVNITMVEPVGRVKKIPKACREAVKRFKQSK